VRNPTVSRFKDIELSFKLFDSLDELFAMEVEMTVTTRVPALSLAALLVAFYCGGGTNGAQSAVAKAPLRAGLAASHRGRVNNAIPHADDRDVIPAVTMNLQQVAQLGLLPDAVASERFLGSAPLVVQSIRQIAS
jgi:hypothetical protein